MWEQVSAPMLQPTRLLTVVYVGPALSLGKRHLYPAHLRVQRPDEYTEAASSTEPPVVDVSVVPSSPPSIPFCILRCATCLDMSWKPK